MDLKINLQDVVTKMLSTSQAEAPLGMHGTSYCLISLFSVFGGERTRMFKSNFCSGIVNTKHVVSLWKRCAILALKTNKGQPMVVTYCWFIERWPAKLLVWMEKKMFSKTFLSGNRSCSENIYIFLWEWIKKKLWNHLSRWE